MVAVIKPKLVFVIDKVVNNDEIRTRTRLFGAKRPKSLKNNGWGSEEFDALVPNLDKPLQVPLHFSRVNLGALGGHRHSSCVED